MNPIPTQLALLISAVVGVSLSERAHAETTFDPLALSAVSDPTVAPPGGAAGALGPPTLDGERAVSNESPRATNNVAATPPLRPRAAKPATQHREASGKTARVEPRRSAKPAQQVDPARERRFVDSGAGVRVVRSAPVAPAMDPAAVMQTLAAVLMEQPPQATDQGAGSSARVAEHARPGGESRRLHDAGGRGAESSTDGSARHTIAQAANEPATNASVVMQSLAAAPAARRAPAGSVETEPATNTETVMHTLAAVLEGDIFAMRTSSAGHAQADAAWRSLGRSKRMQERERAAAEPASDAAKLMQSLAAEVKVERSQPGGSQSPAPAHVADDTALPTAAETAGSTAAADVPAIGSATPDASRSTQRRGPFDADGTRVVMSERSLDEVRGGFVTPAGLKISFGIERAVYINGALVTTTSLNVVAPVISAPNAPVLPSIAAPVVMAPDITAPVKPTLPSVASPVPASVAAPSKPVPASTAVPALASNAITPASTSLSKAPVAPVSSAAAVPPTPAAAAAPVQAAASPSAAPALVLAPASNATAPTPAASTALPVVAVGNGAPASPALSVNAAPPVSAAVGASATAPATSVASPTSVPSVGNVAPTLATLLPNSAASGSLALIQSGAGNQFAQGVISASSLGTVIQNTLNDQKIQTLTVINATVNSVEVLTAMRLQSALRSAVVDSLRR